jgi:cytochrome c5
MNMRLVLGTLAMGIMSLFALAAQQAPQSPAKTNAKQAAQTNAKQENDEGERLFKQHCSRCHNAPEGFSQRISGTVVRHMRVRASLSRREEEVLLHYFNP